MDTTKHLTLCCACAHRVVIHPHVYIDVCYPLVSMYSHRDHYCQSSRNGGGQQQLHQHNQLLVCGEVKKTDSVSSWSGYVVHSRAHLGQGSPQNSPARGSS